MNETTRMMFELTKLSKNMISGDDSSSSDNELKINEAYASKYNEWRRKEELQKLRDRYGDKVDQQESSSSSSESEDEDAEALTPQLEEDWLKTLAALKSKDPRIYDKSVKFYHSDDSDQTDESAPSNSDDKSGDKKKPVYLKDYHRKIILEKDGMISEDSDDGEEEDVPHSPGYYEEQEAIKKSFQAQMSDSDSSDTELFVKRSKTSKEQEEEEEDYIRWLKNQGEVKEEKVGIELAPLKTYWNDPKLSTNEKFLRDLILNKNYIDKDGKRMPSYNEIVDDGDGFSEEEEFLEKEDQFERKYNFRFEEPDPDFIKSYPRTIKDSVRRKDTKRSEKRKAVKERKKLEKEKIKQEIKQMKNLKRREIMDKIEKLKEITGNPELAFQEDDLETDFDPKKHDEMMKKYFDEEYYGMEEGEQKPEAPKDLEDLQYENWDNWEGGEMTGYEEDYGDYEEDYEPHVDDPDFCMDADYDPSMAVPKSKKKKKKRSKFAEAVTCKKPEFDPDEKTFEEYFDEYYKLDYEDIIAGTPCRFKYRTVQPNSYGLEIDEILKCRDKELNAWVSVKKMSQYKTEEEEENDLRVYRSKGKNYRKKMNILTTLKEEEEGKRSNEKDDRNLPQKKSKQTKKDIKQDEKLEKPSDIQDKYQTPHKSPGTGKFNQSTLQQKRQFKEPLHENNKKKLKLDSNLFNSTKTKADEKTKDNAKSSINKDIKRKKKNKNRGSGISHGGEWSVTSTATASQQDGTSRSSEISHGGEWSVMSTATASQQDGTSRSSKISHRGEWSVTSTATTSQQEGNIKHAKQKGKSKNENMKVVKNNKSEEMIESNVSDETFIEEKSAHTMASHFTQNSETSENSTDSPQKLQKTKKKTLNSEKQRDSQKLKDSSAQSTVITSCDTTKSDKLRTCETNKKKKKKKKQGPPKLSSERLTAFGINPKKVKYMKFDKFKSGT